MLTLAATPIGNLEDIPERLRNLLANADHVYAEDTRQSRKLLNHLGLQRRLASYHEHSPPGVLAKIQRQLTAGCHVAYLSDAGTPGINDPGFQLVRMAYDSGFSVDAVPGPCAVINALILSGLPTHAFCFLGFFPTTRVKQRAMLKQLERMAMTAVFFESPARIKHSLAFLAAELPTTPLAVCREMTKRHQEVLRGTPTQVHDALTTVKGEFVLVLGAVEARPAGAAMSMAARYQQLAGENRTPSQCAKILAKEFSQPKRQVYNWIQEHHGQKS